MIADIQQAVAGAKAGKIAPLYLLWGEEFLVRQGAEALVGALLPPGSLDLNLSTLDGASPRDVAQDLSTPPLFPGTKVVLVRDPEFIAPKRGRTDALGKAKDAWKAGRRKEGARRVLALAARAGWGLADLDPSGGSFPEPDAWKEELNVELSAPDLSFLQEVHAFCKEEGLTAPEGDVSALLAAFERGLPPGQTLIVAATEVDAKNPLVKLAKDKGVLIERKVADRLKDLDLSELVPSVLAPFKKRLAPAAERLLKDRCGGNMRLLRSELEKLALYVGDRPVIDAADVELLVGRAREEEFLELSDALGQRDLNKALRYVVDALDQGAQPLALLGAFSSICRTLIENRERLAAYCDGVAPRSFDDFKARVFPHVERAAQEKGARTPHPYAAFLGLQAAARYRKEELLSLLRACADADLALKTSADGRLTLERLVWAFSGAAPAPPPLTARLLALELWSRS